MDSETSPARDPDNILVQWPSNYALSAKDALALVSLMAFLLVPMLLAMSEVSVWFSFVDHVPLRDQMHGAREWQFLAATVIMGGAAALAGKYLWLVAMCCVLTRASIGHLVAYGRPRRIWRYDRALIVRLYKTDGPALETRLVTPKPIGYIVRLHVAAYAGGALLSAGIGFLPLMHGDHRPWHLAIFFASVALLIGLLGQWEKHKRP